ncbi:hypothetical protein AN477_10630 [Alicyclobacillus ferrooxydans]|uniref:Uncharacterized protein n=1 Tax=Alicyclobacillus ferrooxydans TaxID=471514 RepID=A0A0P9EXF3_9BACL|nr:hypothetical protein AN477_10630 [Alicyclobacillus ferrooxydans]
MATKTPHLRHFLLEKLGLMCNKTAWNPPDECVLLAYLRLPVLTSKPRKQEVRQIFRNSVIPYSNHHRKSEDFGPRRLASINDLQLHSKM